MDEAEAEPTSGLEHPSECSAASFRSSGSAARPSSKNQCEQESRSAEATKDFVDRTPVEECIHPASSQKSRSSQHGVWTTCEQCRARTSFHSLHRRRQTSWTILSTPGPPPTMKQLNPVRSAKQRLTLINPSSDTAIPFGKHRGRSLGELFQLDPGYCHWLVSQSRSQTASPDLKALASWLQTNVENTVWRQKGLAEAKYRPRPSKAKVQYPDNQELNWPEGLDWETLSVSRTEPPEAASSLQEVIEDSMQQVLSLPGANSETERLVLELMSHLRGGSI